MSTYVRDNKEFRARMAVLADAKTHAELENATCAALNHLRATPQLPERSKLAEFVAGLIAYVALGACFLFLIKWVILPVLGAL